jgi:hypothetical protein
VPVTVIPLDPVLSHVNAANIIRVPQTSHTLSDTLSSTLTVSERKNSGAIIPCMLSAPPILCYFSYCPDNIMYTVQVSRDSVVGIATRYGLEGPGIESRWGARFSAPVQTGPGARPASCTMGTRSFPEVMWPSRGASHPTPF